MRRSPVRSRPFIAGLMLAALFAAGPSQSAPSGRAAHHPPAVAADDSDDDADAAFARCQRRAEGRLRVWDRATDAAVSATRRVGHFLGASDETVAHVLRFGHSLSERVQRQLDCNEQQQAEVATARAIAGGVGTTSRWTSETRAHVRGSSTVTARDRTGAGQCLTVTDIVIVGGEETRAPKRMCRRPPSNRYVIA